VAAVLNRRSFFPEVFRYLISFGLLSAIVWVQLRIGGTRPIFALPGYTLIAITGIISLAGFTCQRVAPSSLCIISAVLFFGYLLVRTAFSPLEYLARTNLYLILAALIVYLLTAIHVTGSRPRLVVIGGFLLIAVCHVVVGVIQFAGGNNYLPFDYVRVDYGSRASGFYVCPNHFAGFLECLTLLTLCLALFARVRTWIRILLFCFAATTFFSILISGSRGGYLSSAVGLLGLLLFGIIYCIRVVRRRFTLYLLFGVIAVGVSGLAAFEFVSRSDVLVRRFGSIVDPQNVRIPMWKAALREFYLNPAVGTGSGTYLIYGRKFRDPSVQGDPIYVHNDYLQLLAEYGVAGAALFIVFLGLHLGNGILFARGMIQWLREREQAWSSKLALVVGGLLAILPLIVHSAVDFNLQIPGNTLFVAFLFGILANPGFQWERVNARSAEPALPSLWGILPGLLGLLILLFATSTIPAEADAENARIALEKKSYALSLAYANQGTAKDLRNPNLFYYLGESRRQLGSRFTGIQQQSMLSSAADAFEHGLALFPMDERLLVRCALTYAQLREFAKADDLFRRAFEWSPNLGRIYAYYGLRLQLENRIADAHAAYRRSIQLESNQLAIVGLEQTLEAVQSNQATQ
jgi:O-antigen ligase